VASAPFREPHPPDISDPLEKFSACVGVDSNDRTRGGQGSVAFSVEADGKGLHRTGILREGQGPEKIDVVLGGAKVLDLHASDGDDGPACDHATGPRRR